MEWYYEKQLLCKITSKNKVSSLKGAGKTPHKTKFFFCGREGCILFCSSLKRNDALHTATGGVIGTEEKTIPQKATYFKKTLTQILREQLIYT